MTSIELHVQIHDTYLPILSIPVVECNRFALKPLKWLRFLGYTIYGQEGHICLAPGGELVDYESAIEGQARYFYSSPCLYTYSSFGCFVFIESYAYGPLYLTVTPRLLDIRCNDDRTSDLELDTTDSCADFHDELIDRDGSCVVTNANHQYCDAVHYYPHSKGSQVSFFPFFFFFVFPGSSFIYDFLYPSSVHPAIDAESR
jgi:hypothetical protein